jgi:hypothetical protein
MGGVNDDRDEIARLSAHALLDALSAFDDLTNPDPDPAIRTALRRLAEIDAVTILYDDEADTRTVDLQPVLHAALNLLAASITLHLRDVPDLDGLAVIGDLRAAVDLT